jgi:hypothetical protein
LLARHRQEIAGFAPVTLETLVNGNSNKVVNIASTKMMNWFRHSGAMQSIEPGISRFPDVQLHI